MVLRQTPRSGARRFAHTSWLRADRALRALLGMERFTQGMVVRPYERLWAWQVGRLPKRA